MFPLEITPRFGYPTVSIQMEGVQNPWGEFLYALATKKPYALKTQRGFQVGRRDRIAALAVCRLGYLPEILRRRRRLFSPSPEWKASIWAM